MELTLVMKNDMTHLTVITPDRDPLMTDSNHPEWDKILAGALAKDESIIDMIDLAALVSLRFEAISERVSVRNGTLYLDGDEMHNALADQVLRFLAEGVEDWKPLVAFLEKVQTNVEPHSREQLYGYMERHEITITDDGDVIFYKGVGREEKDGVVTYRPSQAGYGIVDGVEYTNDRLPQRIGSVVQMPRAMVKHDPNAACRVGLHAATFDFAKDFMSGATLEIHVNPRDVVSVPHSAEKIRCCRYRVIREVESAYTAAFARSTRAPDVLGETPDRTAGRLEGETTRLHTVVTMNPTEFEFATLKAKKQRKGIKAVAPTLGWTLTGSDPKLHTSWTKSVAA